MVLPDVVNLSQKLSLFDKLWTPHVVAKLNNNLVKVVKVKDDFVWHTHEDTDELFLVLEGEVRIDFREESKVLKKGELFVVPRGVEHKPFSQDGAEILIIEPAGVVNTGEAGGELTAPMDAWI